MADFSIQGKQNFIHIQNETNTTELSSKEHKLLFQAAQNDKDNITGTSIEQNGTENIKRTTYKDGSYTLEYPDGKSRIYSQDGKWLGGTDDTGRNYTNTYTEDACICEYSDGNIEFYDKDNKVLKGIKKPDGSEEYYNNQTVTHGVTSDADGNRKYTIKQETDIENNNQIVTTQTFEDGEVVSNRRGFDIESGTMVNTTTRTNSDGSYSITDNVTKEVKHFQQPKHQPLDVGLNVSYKMDNIVRTGSLKSIDVTGMQSFGVDIVAEYEDFATNTRSVNMHTTYFEYADLVGNKSHLSFNELKKIAADKKLTSEQTYEYFINYLKENKNNPNNIIYTMLRMGGELSNVYDSEQKRDDVSQSQSDFMDTVLKNNGEEIDNMICITIHDFLMKSLKDAGIEALTLCGSGVGVGEDNRIAANNHAILLYKIGEGQYAITNYDKSVIVNANNIKDAALTVYKYSNEMKNGGYISFTDNNNSYQEYAFKDEASFGNEIDKSVYNMQTPLDMKIADNTSISGSTEISRTGNIRATVDAVKVQHEDSYSIESGLSFEYKNSKETSAFNSSQTYGLKFSNKKTVHKNNNIDLYYDTKEILSYIQGNNNVRREYDNYVDQNAIQNAIQEIENMDLAQLQNIVPSLYVPNNAQINISVKNVNGQTIDRIFNDDGGTVTSITHKDRYYPDNPDQFMTLAFNEAIGYKAQILNTEDLRIYNAGQISLTGSGTISLNNEHSLMGDARISLEESIGIQNRVNDFTFTNQVNVGFLTDVKITTSKGMIRPQPGAKLNVASSVQYTPTSNFTMGAEARAYTVNTRAAKDYGAEGTLYAAYQPGNIKYFGSVNASVYNQHLTLGNFNEQTEKTVDFSTTVGAQVNNRTALTLTYGNHSDRLNNTRNTQSVMLGAKINF